MSQKRLITYTCDACLTEAPQKRDLRRFTINTTPWKNAVSLDVCDSCEAKFIVILQESFKGIDPSVLRRNG